MACAMVTGRIPSAAKAAINFAALAARLKPRPFKTNAKPRIFHSLPLACVLIACVFAFAQDHTTVRHYKERIDDQPPEIAQAEDAIQKGDFIGAETLLKKAIDKDPK